MSAEKNQDDNYPLDKKSLNFDLMLIFQILWNGKLLISLSILVSIIFSVFYLRNAEYLYNVSMTVIPVSSSQTSSSNSLNSLARVLSLNIQQDSEGSFGYYKSIIKSQTMASELSKDTDFMRKVFSGSWDDANKKWKTPQRTNIGKLKVKIKELIGLPIFPLNSPGEREILLILSDIKINSQFGGNLTYLSYLTSDPDFGVYLLNTVDKFSNKILKERSVQKTRKYIDFLNERLETVQKKGQREALVKTLSEQLRSMMIASSDFPFAAEKFNFPHYFNIPNSPKASNVFIFSFILGLTVGIVIVVFIFLVKLFLFKRN